MTFGAACRLRFARALAKWTLWFISVLANYPQLTQTNQHYSVHANKGSGSFYVLDIQWDVGWGTR
jgi:hypothetical protein